MKEDLVVLVADKNMEYAMRGIFERQESLNTLRFSYHIIVHSQRDPGVYKDSHNVLRSYQNKYNFALVVFDKEGCGSSDDICNISHYVQDNLDRSGWQGRSKVIVIDPELEIWIWSDSPEVAFCIGWSDSDLKEWLISEGYLLPHESKPERPKEVFERALSIKDNPRSSSMYRKIALKVSLERCRDKSFLRLKQILQIWFPL